MGQKKVKVINDKERPVAAELLAQAIVEISEGMRLVNASRLTRDAVVVLIKKRTGISEFDINRVLNNLSELEKNWLKPRAG